IARAEPNDIDLALESMELSLALRESLGIKHEIAETLAAIAGILSIYKGELNHALELVDRILTLVQKSNKIYELANCLSGVAIVYSIKGDLDQSISYFEQSLKLFKKINNKAKIAGVLNNLSDDYKKRGDLDRALECIVESMELNRNVGMIIELANNHDFLIQILIDKGELDQAQMWLHDLEQLNVQLKDRFINVLYLLNKALILKTSSRAIKRGKAEEILKQLLEDKNLHVDDLHIRIRTLLNLCELLLTELCITNNLEVLEELNQFIAQLLGIAENSHSYWIMGETYLLQAKLALVLSDLKEARLLLTQGQQLSEKNGLHMLAVKISMEHDELLEREKDWEILNEKGVPLAERIELASVDGIMDRLQGRKVVDLPELVDEQPILLLIMDKGGIPYFNHDFEVNWDHSDLFGSFMSAFNTFSDELFSKSIDRIRIGENTILINPVDRFLACYVIRGQSYLALQKLTRFTKAIRENSDIWYALNKSVKTHEMLELNKPPVLKTVIDGIF
ncbi:MAG: tetratricopeptide repeat protein, partial [Candidatus Hodarchaeales archaeon]